MNPVPTEPTPRPSVASPAGLGNAGWLAGVTGWRLDLLVIGLLTAIAAVVFRDFLIFDRVYLFKDMGADTVNGHYPRLVHIANYLRTEGIPGWSFQVGMGQFAMPGNLGNPFEWILYLLGADRIAYAFAYIEVLKIVLGGWIFSRFLRLLDLTPFTALTGSVLFAFSGFMILGGSWFAFSTEAVYLALLLYAFERYLQHGAWILIPVTFFLVAAGRPFNLFNNGVFIAIYAAFRFFDLHGPDFRGYFRHLAGLTGLAVLGAMMGAFFLIPDLREMLGSVRVAGKGSESSQLMATSLFRVESAKHYGTAIMRLFSNDLIGTADKYRGWRDYLAAPMFYIGMLPLLLFPFAFIGQPSRRRALRLGFLGIMLLPVLLPFLRYTFWLFSGDYYRIYSFMVALVVLLLALFAFDRLDRGDRVPVRTLGVTLAVLLAALYLTPILTELQVDTALQGRVAAILVTLALLLFALGTRVGSRWTQGALLLVVVCEVVWIGCTAATDRPNVTREDLASKTGYNDDSADAVAWLRGIDPGFYRVEKTFTSSPSHYHVYRNDSQIQGYFSTSSYHRFNQPAYIRFVDAVGPPRILERSKYRAAIGLFKDPPLQSLTSVKYLISKKSDVESLAANLSLIGEFAQRFYEPFHQVGEVTIFRQREFLPLGFTYDRQLSDREFRDIPKMNRGMLLAYAFIPDPQNRELAAAFPPFDPKAPAKTLWEAFDERRREVLRISHFGHNRIEGDITVTGKKLLFFSIPFDTGWSAEVNGKPQTLVPVNIGLMGLVLAAGEHHVSLTYQSPFRLPGLLLSCLSMGVFASMIVAARMRNRRGARAS
ncbi:MAG: YfhO family protein [Leptospirillia bacterium]